MTRQHEDLIGQKFGKLTPLHYKSYDEGWICRCDCGGVSTVKSAALKNGSIQSCSHTCGSTKIDETGNVYERLTVIGRSGSGRSGGAHWLCECECSNITSVRGAHLRSGHTKSCGCLKRTEPIPIHIRDRKSSQYYDWRQAVLDRDNNECQACTSQDRLTAHHMLSYTMFPDSRFDVDNGVTLCSDCHIEYHSEYGKMPVSVDTTLEFIANKTMAMV